MWVCGGKRGSGPEGADDLCCFYLSFKAGIRAWRLGFGPRDQSLGIETRIWASSQDLELGLEAGI